MTPLGEKIRELRQERGASQKEMAAAIGVSPAYLSALEHGRRGAPSWTLIQKIIGYFNIIWDEAEEFQRIWQAAVNAVHTDALDASMTDWRQVVQLYDRLRQMAPGPVVELNRAVAVAEVDGPEVGLALVEPLPLEGYHAWHAARADLLRRSGRSAEARLAYDRAIELAGNEEERAWLRSRRDTL